MTGLFLKPSEFKSLQKLTCNQHYKLKNFMGNGNFSSKRKVILEDVFTKHEVIGKIVTTHNEGEFSHWPGLWHENLSPLLEMISIHDDMTLFLYQSIGKSLKVTVEETNFMLHPKCFDRKKSYAKDVLCGLEYLHEQALCLTNLSDENILICSLNDMAVISDFSSTICCKKATKRKLSAIRILPSPPELMRTAGEELIECMPVDMWYCGVTFLRIFTRHVLPWCPLCVDLLSGLDVELLRQTNLGSYLDNDSVVMLREFLKQFFEPDPKIRVRAIDGIASTFLRIESDRLDKARDFWKACEESQIFPENQDQITRIQQELFNDEILRGASFEEKTSDSLSSSSDLGNNAFGHIPSAQTRSRINIEVCAHKVIDCPNKSASICTSFIENLYAVDAENNTGLSKTISEKPKHFKTFYSDFNLKDKFNVENADEYIQKDKSDSVNKLISASFEPNFKKTENKTTLKDSPSLDTVKSYCSVLSLENTIMEKECPCRLSGISCSNEIFTNVSLEEYDRTLVLPDLIHKIRKNSHSAQVSLSNMAEKLVTAEDRIQNERRFLHSDPQGRRKKSSSSCAIYNGLKPIKHTWPGHEVRDISLPCSSKVDESAWHSFSNPFDDISYNTRPSIKKKTKKKGKNKKNAKSIPGNKEVSRLPEQNSMVDVPMGIPLCGDVGSSNKCKQGPRPKNKSKRRLIRCLCPGSKFGKKSKYKQKKKQNTNNNE